MRLIAYPKPTQVNCGLHRMNTIIERYCDVVFSVKITLAEHAHENVFGENMLDKHFPHVFV